MLESELFRSKLSIFEKNKKGKYQIFTGVSRGRICYNFPSTRQDPIYRRKCSRRYSGRIQWVMYMYMFVYVLYTQAAVEGGEGGGSVQLLTGGRRVSQASPTLSPAILEPSSFVAAVTRQFRWTSRFTGYTESRTIFVTNFPWLIRIRDYSSAKNSTILSRIMQILFLGYYILNFEKNSVRI